MIDDDFEELMVMVEREEGNRNRDLGLDVMDVVGDLIFLILYVPSPQMRDSRNLFHIL